MQSQNSKLNVQEKDHTIKKRAFALKICFLLFYVSSLFRVKFERILFFRDDVVNSLLLIEELLIARSRDRSQDAENIIRRQAAFETSINREFSRFEHVKAKATILHNEDVASEVKNVLHRADSALGRRRRQERERERERESIVAAEQRENIISAVEEERERDRERDRGRER
jgi:hypothetical protein